MLAEKIIEKKIEPDCDCSILGSINVISGKWKPVIIWMLLSGPKRFGALHRSIQGISLKVLSRHLKELEADGIITRKVYAEVPPKVEYTLTEKGLSLNEVMQLLAEWGKKYEVAE